IAVGSSDATPPAARAPSPSASSDATPPTARMLLPSGAARASLRMERERPAPPVEGTVVGIVVIDRARGAVVHADDDEAGQALEIDEALLDRRGAELRRRRMPPPLLAIAT